MCVSIYLQRGRDAERTVHFQSDQSDVDKRGFWLTVNKTLWYEILGSEVDLSHGSLGAAMTDWRTTMRVE